MPHPVRGIAREIVTRVGHVETWSGEFDALPPVPPNTLRETCVSRWFNYRAMENDTFLWSDVPFTGDGYGFGSIHYALEPFVELPAPPPNRFHTCALNADNGFGIVPLGADTDRNDLALYGHFEISRFPFFNPVVFPFPGWLRLRLIVCAENDNPGVTYTQRFSVTFRYA